MTPISVPLDFPKVEPNDWEKWNKVWETNKKIVHKIATTKNTGQVPWIGFDIYVKDGIDADDVIKYHGENVNCPELFNSLFDNLDKLPIDLHVVRVLQSTGRVKAHQDFAVEADYQSIRSILYDNNPKQTWYYESNQKKQYLNLPEETNTWWYDDAKIKHATDFYEGYSKQLIMYRGTIKQPLLSSMVNQGVNKYPEYVIYV